MLVNPPADRMPIRVPAFVTAQTPLSYADQLRQIGLGVEIREAQTEVEGGIAGTVQSVAPDERALPQQKVTIYVDAYGDPTADNEIPECRISNPTNADPAPGRGGLRAWPNSWNSLTAMLLAFQPYRSRPFTRNSSTGGPGAVTLHWGVVIRESNDWKGFAYRKIAAKHGWSTLDDQPCNRRSPCLGCCPARGSRTSVLLSRCLPERSATGWSL